MSPVTDLPAPGGTLLTEQMTVRVGGAGANAALASVEAGLEAAAHRVHRRGSPRRPGCAVSSRRPASPTSWSWCRGRRAGSRSALESRERDRTLPHLPRGKRAVGAGDDSRRRAHLRQPRSVRLLRRAPAPGRRRATAARHRARRAAGAHSSTPRWDPDGFSSQTRAEVLGLLPSVDVFLPNEVEAFAIVGSGMRRAMPARRRAPSRPPRAGGSWSSSDRADASRPARTAPSWPCRRRPEASPTPPAPATPSTPAWCTRWRAGRTGRTRWRRRPQFATTIISRPSDRAVPGRPHGGES